MKNCHKFGIKKLTSQGHVDADSNNLSMDISPYHQLLYFYDLTVSQVKLKQKR